MDIFGSYTFNAPSDRVWALLMDPAVLSSCIPGCEKFEADGEGRYNVTLTVGLAAITGTYHGHGRARQDGSGDVVPVDRGRSRTGRGS